MGGHNCRFSSRKLILSISLVILQGFLGHLLAQDSTVQQQAETDSIAKVDTVEKKKPGFLEKLDTIQFIANQEQKKSQAKYDADRISRQRTTVIAELLNTGRSLKEALNRGLDTNRIRNEIAEISRMRDIAGDGIFSNKGTAQTARNLEASKVLLSELESEVIKNKADLELYSSELSHYRSRIDSLQSDSVIYQIPQDSAEAIAYLQKLVLVNVEVAPVDSNLTKTNKLVHQYINQLGLLHFSLQTDLREIDEFRKKISMTSLQREFVNIWQPRGYARPFREILRFSAKKGAYVFQYYVTIHRGKIVLMLLLIWLVTYLLKNIKKSVLEKTAEADILKKKTVLRYPWLSAVFIVFNIYQFIFPDPPFVFYGTLWMIAATALTIINFRAFTTGWGRIWNVLYVLFLFTYIDNSILQASRTERWIIFFLSLAGILLSLSVVYRRKSKDLKERRIIYFMVIMGLLHIVAFIANIYGRYNFSKIWMTAGYFNMAVGVMLLWTVRMINETLEMSSDSWKRVYNKVFYLNLSKVNQSVPKYIYLLLTIGWFALMARNFYFYSVLSDNIGTFLNTPRILGKYSFTVGSMVTFFLIIIAAAVTSKFISFFASESDSQVASDEKKPAIGSWLLLIRIAIITGGVVLALAAAGIPLDRITIILGALGVGIGLGLQSIVNNLVSGLILAFEKPINVGDVVEVGKQHGIMKSIGFRASVISTWDGADVIIPNGDLMNQHLINWTGQNRMRRVEILVGVAYGTDLPLVQNKLAEMLASDDRIMHVPPPVVLIVNFNNSSIDYRILFWVANYNTWLAVKSDVILKIDKLFKENNITIPFPQQDIHIKAESLETIKSQMKTGGADNDEAPLPPMTTPG